MHRAAWLTAIVLPLWLADGAAESQPDPSAPAATAHSHHVHARSHRRKVEPVPAPLPPQAAAQAPAGTQPAPMPNENIGPPHQSTDTTTVDPGSPQIHYPSLGNGFLPGSSSQTLENLRSSQIPGATVHVPIQQPPQELPPPEAGGH